MDRSQARWRFETVNDDYGIRVSLVDPSEPERSTPPASAVIRTDWDSERISATLRALEGIYDDLPEPTPPPTEET